VSEELFYDPAVIKVIRRILVSAGIRAEHDLEEVTNEVVLACIKQVRKTGRPPKDVAEAIAIARPIAKRMGASWVRTRIRRGKSNLASQKTPTSTPASRIPQSTRSTSSASS